MGSVRKIPLSALVAGILYVDDDVYCRAMEVMEDTYGSLGLESDAFPFDMTDYYTAEMGGSLHKKFVCFSDPVDPGCLSDIKLFTNTLETELVHTDTEDVRRRINIDPGYVTLAKLVLASTKDYSHRIYIGGGIFAETTLRFLKTSFTPLETTYPDYASPQALEFFNKVRAFVKENRRLWTRNSE